MIKKGKKFLEVNKDYFYFGFRVLVGLMFLQHGVQKMFGMLGGTKVELLSTFGLAGTIELVAGLLIIVGLFTQIAALAGIVDMIGAFYIAHLPKGIVPIINGGELAVMFFASFLVLLVWGAGKWGLDNYFE